MTTSSDLQNYLSSIGRLPVLTKEAQLRHARRIHAWVNTEGGKQNASRSVQRLGQRSLNILVETNLRLVVSIAKKYQNRGVELIDLIQEGNLGLIRGLELYDPTRGYQISTYCYWWVRQSVTRAIYTKGRTIRIPVSTFEVITRALRYIDDKRVARGKVPTWAEVAEYVNTTEARLQEMFDLYEASRCTSLDRCCVADGESRANLVDLIPSSTEVDIFERIDKEISKDRLDIALNSLSAPELHVLSGLFEDGSTQKQIGTELGVCRSRVGKLKQKAIQKMQKKMRSESVIAA